MQTIFENRASTILYNIIISNNINKGLSVLPSHICPIVPTVYMKANADFIFVDIEENDFLLSQSQVIDLLRKEKNISSILYNHTLGYDSSNQDFFKKIKSISPETIIIDDKCLVKPVITASEENIADVELYSTGYSKFVDLSFGGYAFISDKIKYNAHKLKYNSLEHDNLVEKFNTVLSSKKKFVYEDTDWLDTSTPKISNNEYINKISESLVKITAHKNQLNKIYSETINNKYHFPEGYSNWRFNILVNNKDFILKKIFENKLFASSHYQSLSSIFGNGTSKNAEYLHSKIINLFNDHRFSEEMAYKVSDIINKYAE